MTYRSALAFGAAALVTVAARRAAAEEAPPKEETARFGGAVYLMPGVRQLRLGAVNQQLGEAGYSRIGPTFLSAGLGGHVMVGRFRIGGEGHFLAGVGGDGARGTTRANVSGGYGMFRFGYAVIATERFSLYPMMGLGGGGLNLNFRQQGASDFGQIVVDPRRDATLTRGGLLLDAALGADYRIPVTRRDGGEGFVLVGLRGSYTYGPSMGGWSSPGGALPGALTSASPDRVCSS